MMTEHFERLNKQSEQLEAKLMEDLKQATKEVKERFEEVRQDLCVVHENLRESLGTVHENLRESLQIMQESNLGEKGEIKVDDAEEQPKINDKSQIEISTSVQEQQPVTENRETKETETSAVEFSGRHGERKAPDEQNMETKVAERINSKPRQSRVKGLAAAGARRKKKSKFSKEKLEGLKKNTHKKSSKEAFQAWINPVRKKHHEEQTTEKQRHVPWDPGGVVYKIHQKFSGIEASVTH
jgi:hypothetical protein